LSANDASKREDRKDDIETTESNRKKTLTHRTTPEHPMHINSKTATTTAKKTITSTSFGMSRRFVLSTGVYLMALFVEEACMEKMLYQLSERVGCKQPESPNLIGS
jgi:hypothetical protein